MLANAFTSASKPSDRARSHFGGHHDRHRNSPTINDEIHAPMGGVRDSGWGRTGPDSLADFTDVIWINTTSSERQFPF